MTSLERPVGVDPPDQLADGAAGEAPPADDPVAVSVAGFAAQLRELRERAGRPSYRRLAQLAHYSHSALSQAAAGYSLPSLAVTQAFVRACGGDVEEWSARWRQVDQVVRPSGEPPCPSVPCAPVPGTARPDSGWRSAAGWLGGKGGVGAVAVLAATACIIAVALWLTNPTTATSQPHLQMESSGSYVRYATVTNLGSRTGHAYIINSGVGKMHRSPRPVPPGQSWTYFFNRELKDGAQICGSINLGPATCASVRR